MAVVQANVLPLSSASTLVETVNINLEDFSELFLTCSTCLCVFDEEERKAKLLPCSHSVCLCCLEQLAALPQNAATGRLRCPLCREDIGIPLGGAAFFPASFLINQLRDVLRRQRRDVVPSCSLHPQEGLLYCESCDHVFCPNCHSVKKKCELEQHTVIAFSLALKRMSEIAQFRNQGRLRSLQRATQKVTQEITLLDENVDRIVDQLNETFQSVYHAVESRRRELIESVRVRRDEKRKVLRDQLEAISDEKKQLEKELDSCQVEVREVARRMKRLSTSDARLTEPKENAFLKINTDSLQLIADIEKCLNEYGTISASTTFPGESCLQLDSSSCVHTETHIVLRTFDVAGRRRLSGGDPVDALLCNQKREQLPITVHDKQDGTYLLTFRVEEPGDYSVDVKIFGRPVQNSPLMVTVSAHHSVLWEASVELKQPTRVAIDAEKHFYVLDTGNNRIRVLKENGEVMRDIGSPCLEGCTVVGFSLLKDGRLALLNWKTRSLSTCSPDGTPQRTIVFSEFKEPIDLAIDHRGRFIIADADKVFVLDPSLKPVFSFPPSNHERITCVSVGMDDDILVGTTSALLLFDGGGRLQREIATGPSNARSKSMVTCCVTCPRTGRIVCGVVDSRSNRAELSVCNYKGEFLFRIESSNSRLRRPSGLALTPEGVAFCVDYATHTLRMYKFK